MNANCGICGRQKKRNRFDGLGCPHCDDPSDFMGIKSLKKKKNSVIIQEVETVNFEISDTGIEIDEEDEK